eukprot:1451713-Amphidinium_carterae.2
MLFAARWASCSDSCLGLCASCPGFGAMLCLRVLVSGSSVIVAMKFLSGLPVNSDGLWRTVVVREPGPPALVDTPRQASTCTQVGGRVEGGPARFVSRDALVHAALPRDVSLGPSARSLGSAAIGVGQLGVGSSMPVVTAEVDEWDFSPTRLRGGRKKYRVGDAHR